MFSPIAPRRYAIGLVCQQPYTWRVATRDFASKRPAEGDDEAELAAARQWLKKLDPDTIPRDICEVSFSRSSGPGGQNVNK